MINTQKLHCERSDITIAASKSSVPQFPDYFFLNISTAGATYELTITANDARNLAEMIYAALGSEEPNPNQQPLFLSPERMTA